MGKPTIKAPKRLHVILPGPLADALRELAQARHKTESEVIRDLIRKEMEV